MKPRFFTYVRKSTDTEEKQVLSIESQLEELRVFAAREKLEIASEFVEARTAKIPGRPIFDQLIARIEEGEANGILAWHPDRLARNSVDGGRIIYLIDTGRLQFLKFPTFWFECTPQGLFMLSIAFGQSKYFSDNLSENVRRGMRQKLRRGEWPAQAPLGYLNKKGTGKIVVDPERSRLVRKLFEEFASGKYTVESIKRASWDWGLTARYGKPLVTSQIHSTLANSFYYGLLKYFGETFQGAHEPLISKETFDKAQAILRKNKVVHIQRRHEYPFLGLFSCATCGCAITAERQKGHVYYRCTKKRGPCSEPYVREEALSSQIGDALLGVALPDDTYEKMANEWAKEWGESRAQRADRKKVAADELAIVKSKLDRLLDAHLSGTVDTPEYLAKKESLLNKKVGIEQRMGKIEGSALSALERTKDFLESAHQAGPRAIDPDQNSKKDFFETIGSNRILKDRKISFSHNMPWTILTRNRELSEWCLDQESNLDLKLRRLAFYPLNYRGEGASPYQK